MRDREIIKGFLIEQDQDPDRVKKFIDHLFAWTNNITQEDIDIPCRPFLKGSMERRQLSEIHKSSKALFLALWRYKDSKNIDRLAHYLEPTNSREMDSGAVIGTALSQAERIYSAANYALYHGEKTGTGGRPDSLSEVEKLKLRRLKGLFKHYFPKLSDSFNGEKSTLFQIGCNLLGRDTLGRNPDKAIQLKSLEMAPTTKFKQN